MKNLIILISISALLSCSGQHDFGKYSSYIFDTLQVQPLKDQKQYFAILNPKASCTSCYLGIIENVSKLKNKYSIKIITDFDLSRYVEDKQTEVIIDNDLRFLDANPGEVFNSKFLIFENKKLIFSKTVGIANADSIESYIAESANDH